MVQALCRGEEFSIDVFCDLDGRCLAAIPRTMIESKGGESIKGMTIKDEELIEFGCRVSEALSIIGPANVQCFREPDGALQVTDVNPRFGGGFPLPTAAGSQLPRARARARERRAARAAPRRLPRRRRDDAVLLAGDPRGRRRHARAGRRAGGGGARGSVRRLALLLAGAALLAGCGAQQREAATTAPAPTTTVRHRAPEPDLPKHRARPRAGHGRRRRHEPPRARCARDGRHPFRAQRPPRRRADPARAPRGARHRGREARDTRRGRCGSRSARTRSRRSGSTAARCSGRCTAPIRAARSSRRTIHVRPPFRVVWSRGLGGLIEFPAVVSDGVAYIANARGTVRALDMRNGRRALAARHAAREDGGVARRLARPARRARDGRPRLGAPPLRRQAPLALHRRLAGRVVAGDRRRRRRVRRLERHRSRRSTCGRTGVRWRRYGGCKVTSSAALAGSTLYIGDYCGRLLALSRANGRAALVAQRQRPRLRDAGRRRRAASSSRARPAGR